jgi:NADPH:quinone reductase-like Zn-dependent oxidoreductase
VVLPLAVSTACSGLYPKNLLNLPLPSATKPEKNGKAILIWGGASSVGATAIQLAAASGATIITTASPANHDLVKSLGADFVFDYKSSAVVEDIVEVLERAEFVGINDAIGEEKSFEAESAILDRLQKKVSVASVLPSEKSTDLFAPVYGQFQRLADPLCISVAKSIQSLRLPSYKSPIST